MVLLKDRLHLIIGYRCPVQMKRGSDVIFREIFNQLRKHHPILVQLLNFYSMYLNNGKESYNFGEFSTVNIFLLSQHVLAQCDLTYQITNQVALYSIKQ